MLLTRSNARRRLRRPGQVFILIGLLVLLAAWNTGTNLYYLVFAGLASFILLSWPLSKWNVRRLELRCTAPDAVHRCDAFAVSARIENSRRFFPSVSIRVERADRRGESSGYVLTIPPGQAAQFPITERCEKRGVFPLPEFDLVSTFPFGLFECRKRVRAPGEIVVYPRVVAARTALVERARSRGPAPRVAHGDGDDFFSLREYQPGDDLRYVAWRVSARLGELMVREFDQQANKSVLFAFDSRYDSGIDGFEEHFEKTIEVLASLAVTLLNRRYHVALLTATDYVQEDDGPAQTLKLLDALARVEPDPPETPDPFGRAAYMDEGQLAIHLYVTPDPGRWGERTSGTRIIDPGEVVHV
ncbi:MAG: DUF58 domain-containing protein [bacterium]|nr:DUF58 domain-containing protein [bacterium]